ncbi:PREDICTED: extracellular calcium-sensing receptor-like [Nanorana parkeri]|uniref:extracellular calcium-sensing receptor-like n=1 Tax=Nanorana parkeri TaxID=125878 RepID=UPI000854B4C3|nr:PREDICTED: extracellular calcium-sensing receptor-like [Nanorana parkeri]
MAGVFTLDRKLLKDTLKISQQFLKTIRLYVSSGLSMENCQEEEDIALDRSVIPGIFRRGDVLIGGVFPVKRTKTFGNVMFTDNPSTQVCDDRSYRWLQALIFTVQEMNNDPYLLPNTTLGYAIFDTCDNIAEVVKEMFTLISGPTHEARDIPNYHCQTNSTLAAVIGESASVISIAMARILGTYHYPQVSYFSSINILSNKQEFPSFFRTIPSDTFQTTALAAMVEHFGWTWVGTVAEDNDYGHLGVQLFTEQIVRLGVCVAFSETIPLVYSKTKYEQIAATIKRSSAKVIIVVSGDTNLIPLIWEVAKQNIRGRTWIASEGWSTSAFVLEKDQSHFFSGTLGLAIPTGTISGLKEFLLQVNPLQEPEDPIIKLFWENMFGCSWLDLSQSQNITNICTGKENLSSVNNTYTDVSQLRITFNVYNAAHAMANALQSLIYCGNEPCRRVHDIQPWQLVRALKRVNFTDRSGDQHYFDQNGDPVPKYDVLNWQMGNNGLLQYKKVGSYSDRTPHRHQLVMDEQETLWNGDMSQPPVSVCSASCKLGFRKSILHGQPACCFTCIPCPDGEISNGTDSTECIKCDQDYWSNKNKTVCVPKEVDYLSFGEPLGITFSTAASLGIFKTIAVTLVFIKYKNTPIVRAQNLEMSFLLLTSLLVSFIGTFTFIGEPSTTLCVLRQTVFAISFVLNISCVLVKTLVVIIAFTMAKPNQSLVKFFQPSHQRALVGLTTSVQIAICVGFFSSTSLIMKKNRDTIIAKIILECNRESELAFLVAIGYIGLLALVCFVLAFLARNLPDNFNEAKFITFSLLVFVMVWVCFIPGYLSTSGKYVTAVEIFAILSSAAGLLVCIFFPKCYIILLRPSSNSKKNLMGHSYLKR